VRRGLLDSFRNRELLAFGLHDCYAREWLDSYEDLLQELAQLERFITADELCESDLSATGMKASIIIPLKRQRDAWLEQCVRSATTQTAECEVIVIHSVETPASNVAILAAIAEERCNLRVVVEEKPGSFPAAINLGIRLATAPRIGLLLADDWLEPDAVERCLPIEADIVATGHTIYFGDGVTVQEGAGQIPSMAEYRALPAIEARAAYLEHFFLFRKEALEQVGGLDESIGNFPGIDDYDLIWTLLESRATVGLVEAPLYNYRDHDEERLTLADSRQASANLAKILRKHGIPEEEIPGRVRDASRWYGRPIHQVIADSKRDISLIFDKNQATLRTLRSSTSDV
jgi:glycosyltransferase involved in cell wall biosynthesis